MAALRCSGRLHVVVLVLPILLSIARSAASIKCIVESVTALPGSDGLPGCFEDYDSDSKPAGKFCGDHSAVGERVLTKMVFSELSNKEKILSWAICGAKCSEAGYTGIAGVEDSDECWCSNTKTAKSTWKTDASGECNNRKCPGDGNPCGGRCLITLFTYTCQKQKSTGPSGALIGFLVCFTFVLVYFVGGITYNKVQGQSGAKLLPHAAFWGSLGSLCRTPLDKLGVTRAYEGYDAL